MKHLWVVRRGKITNGKTNIGYDDAYNYIAKQTKVYVMDALGIDEESYAQFKDLVCRKLNIPSDLC